MTQKELVLEYVKEVGSIVPARMSGKIYLEEMFGHSVDKRCRELRMEGKLTSRPWPKNTKFEEFGFYFR